MNKTKIWKCQYWITYTYLTVMWPHIMWNTIINTSYVMLYNSQKNGVNENWVTRFQVVSKSVLGVCGPMYGLYQKIIFLFHLEYN